MNAVAHEARALARSFWFTSGNSKEQKLALWIAMTLFFLVVLGALGFLRPVGVYVDLKDENARLIFDVLLAVMTGLWGRVQGHESALLRAQRDASRRVPVEGPARQEPAPPPRPPD